MKTETKAMHVLGPKKYRQNWNVTVQKTQKVQHANGGTSWVPAPDERHQVELTIDVQGIAAWLGNRAAHNKSGVAKFMSGMVVVRDLGKIEAAISKAEGK